MLDVTASGATLKRPVAMVRYLGLVMPGLTVLNPDNYAVFALCITMLELDCLDKYAEGIRKRNSLPFVPSPKAVKKSNMRSDT